ncbi:cation-transporting P-type ATPase [Candidatus Woesebacteria bacterium]|nr:cation-transporting P-type ATPase [Candidatus Woesebacteria bacterium]
MAFSRYTTATVGEVFHVLATSNQGLSTNAVKQRLLHYGPNYIQTDERGWKTLLARQFTSPFVYLLIGACLLALWLGETLDAIMIFLFITINTVLGFYQEYRSEQTLKLLKKYLTSQSTVTRDGKEMVVDVTGLVPGDVIHIEPGDIIPADIRFTITNSLIVDESILTGESVPVEKNSEALKIEEKSLHRARNMGFSGTTVVAGKGAGVVVATGKNTTYGDIVRLSTAIPRQSTFEKDIAKFSKFTLALVCLTLVLIVIAHLLLKPSPSLVEIAIFSLALAVSVIPEALPVVITFSLSLGALRLAKNNVVVKRLSAIEDLGSIEILCSDKTGTLTENKLSVDEIYGQDKNQVLLYANLASPLSGFERNRGNSAFDAALLTSLPQAERTLRDTYRQLGMVPFDPLRKRTSALLEKSGARTLVVRGAAEDVLGICDLSGNQKEKLNHWMQTKGKMGSRVLAVAARSIDKKETYDIPTLEQHLKFIGLLAFIDPIKPSTAAAVAQAKQLAVQVKILTGDSREVAGNVAFSIHLIDSPAQVITGSEFEQLSLGEQHQAVDRYQVFARVTPQQKYNIIRLLQESYEVGFLGEGINDAPALKIANVALAVAGASDIAKEASDIVLLKKSLKVIVDGIREGRQVFANTTKYITATLSANFGNFFAIATASLLIDFLPLLPLQILLVNLLSDFPMIAIATDTVDAESINRPRRYDIRGFALIALLLGMVSTIFDFLFFGVFFRQAPATLQTSWFIGSILTELLFVFSIRTRSFFLISKPPAPFLILLSSAAFLTTVLLPYTPLGHGLFHFESPTLANLAIIFIIVFFYFITTETVKLIYYKFTR